MSKYLKCGAEQKYIVLKEDDVIKYLNEEQTDTLGNLCYKEAQP